MNIKVNGKDQSFNSNRLSIANLLKTSDVENPERVTIQLNGEFVKKEDLAKINLKNNDAVDFLYFMGGGSY